MKIRLPDGDRERLGAPEELDCDVTVFTIREAEAMEDATGIIPEDALELMNPDREQLDAGRVRLRFKPQGIQLRIWLGLYRAGIKVAYDDLGDLNFWPYAGVAVVGAESGKGGPPSEEPSMPSSSPASGPTE